MKKCFKAIKSGYKKIACGGGVMAFTLPTLPVTDLEAAGTAVAALVAVAVVIGVVIRVLRKA